MFTNKTPIEPYRGFYRAEATYTLERTVDPLARELGLDPVELRRRNLITADELPLRDRDGRGVRLGRLPRPLDVALRASATTPGVPSRGRVAPTTVAAPRGGRGTYVWRASFPWMHSPVPHPDFFPGGWETATVRVERSGGVTVRTGASPHGQGLANTLAPVVARRSASGSTTSPW